MGDLGTNTQAAQAFNRFGLGGRPADVIPTDVIGWLTDQLSGTDPLAFAAPTLTTCLNNANAVMTAVPGSQAYTSALNKLNQAFNNEVTTYVTNAVNTTTPFRERLVWFWANHFAVMAGPTSVHATAGNFVRNAIRPYVTGPFVQMLLAVMQHPAMIVSLNNDVSIGPLSPLGLQRAGSSNPPGINENLARETLELYTVGLAANYQQSDVDALAMMLTGWTVSYTGGSEGFIYESNSHQPGPQTMLGVTYPGEGVADGINALTFLGTHPDTYMHIATKLVTHFTSDTPDPNDIATVNTALSTSGGDLTAAMTAIINLPNAFVAQTKFRPPLDYTIAVLRALAANTPQINNLPTALNNLGEPTWLPPFPNGWSDYGADWATAAGAPIRVDYINNLCNSYNTTDPTTTASCSVGPFLSANTAALMSYVTSDHDKLTILFTSPEFQRR